MPVKSSCFLSRVACCSVRSTGEDIYVGSRLSFCGFLCSGPRRRKLEENGAGGDVVTSPRDGARQNPQKTSDERRAAGANDRDRISFSVTGARTKRRVCGLCS